MEDASVAEPKISQDTQELGIKEERILTDLEVSANFRAKENGDLIARESQLFGSYFPTEVLQSIIEYGVISEDLAKAKGIAYKKRYSSSWNKDEISGLIMPLTNSHNGTFTQLETLQFVTKISKENKLNFVMAITKINLLDDLSEPSSTINDKYVPSVNERITKQIPPNNILGFVIEDTYWNRLKISNNEYVENEEEYASYIANTVAEIVNIQIRNAESNENALGIPIYGTSGKLLWPKISTQVLTNLV